MREKKIYKHFPKVVPTIKSVWPFNRRTGVVRRTKRRLKADSDWSLNTLSQIVSGVEIACKRLVDRRRVVPTSFTILLGRRAASPAVHNGRACRIERVEERRGGNRMKRKGKGCAAGKIISSSLPRISARGTKSSGYAPGKPALFGSGPRSEHSTPDILTQ